MFQQLVLPQYTNRVLTLIVCLLEALYSCRQPCSLLQGVHPRVQWVHPWRCSTLQGVHTAGGAHCRGEWVFEARNLPPITTDCAGQHPLVLFALTFPDMVQVAYLHDCVYVCT